MLSIYLDQNHWVYLSAAAVGRPREPDHIDVLGYLREAVRAGTVVVPLSAHHYIETLKREDDESRQRLAALMVELSQLATIAGPGRVVRAELDAALKARYGKPIDPRPLEIFGRGYGFAFGQPTYRYVLPDHLSVNDATRRQQIESFMSYVIETTILAGPVGGSRLPGAAKMRSLDFGGRYAQGERDLNGLLDQPDIPELKALITASEALDLLEPLNEAFDLAGISVGESADLESREGITELIRSLPSRDVVLTLRIRRHANRQTKWVSNDLNDIGSLSIAVAYCDIVVTERSWAHYVRATRLDSRYRAVALSNLSELPAAIGEATTHSPSDRQDGHARRAS